MKKTNGYFQRLKHHNGLELAIGFTIAGTMAGMTNKSFHPLNGAIFGFCISAFFFFGIVLLTNRK